MNKSISRCGWAGKNANKSEGTIRARGRYSQFHLFAFGPLSILSPIRLLPYFEHDE